MRAPKSKTQSRQAATVLTNTSAVHSGFVDYINPATADPARNVLGHMERITLDPGASVDLPPAMRVERASPYVTHEYRAAESRRA